MKTIFSILIFYLGISTIYAQDNKMPVLDVLDSTSVNNITEKEETIVGIRWELSATFKGGNEALKIYLSQNLHYPKTASKAGTVYVKFTVEKDGTITNAIVLKSVEPILDNEALRVIRIMPTWIPAKMYDKTIVSNYVLPIKFAKK
jgi:TonB family protein